VGTDRLDLVNDPTYLGVRQQRMRGEGYFAFIDKFVQAVRGRWPHAIIQWEDLAKEVAFKVLERYRHEIPCFNDDIQGTGAVALAGLISACRIKGESLAAQNIVVFGAGAGGIGVAWALVEGLVREGLSCADAHARVFVIDSKGLLVVGRAMDPYKQAFAQHPERIRDWQVAGAIPTMLEVIQNASATALLGLSGQTGAFNQPIITALGQNTLRPIVFALSNPTSVSEALPEDVVKWTEGRAIVATGSPFADVTHKGSIYSVGQGNNAFIFPGLGFASILSESREITDNMVMDAAYALSDYTAATHLDDGRVYPPTRELQEVAIRVAVRVIRRALDDGVAGKTDLEGRDLDAYVRSRFWKPRYLPFVRGQQ